MVVEEKNAHLKFMLYPDLAKPARIPSNFPLPTHLYKKRVDLNYLAENNALTIGWIPRLTNYSGALRIHSGDVSGNILIGSNGILSYDPAVNTSYGTYTRYYNHATTKNSTTERAAIVTLYGDRLSGATIFGNDRCRLVAALLTIKYIGPLD